MREPFVIVREEPEILRQGRFIVFINAGLRFLRLKVKNRLQYADLLHFAKQFMTEKVPLRE